jgi:thiamine monophosphate kinase
MAGAVRTLNEAECELVGGHTSEGSELALGFAVNAVVSTDAMLRKVRISYVTLCFISVAHERQLA